MIVVIFRTLGSMAVGFAAAGLMFHSRPVEVDAIIGIVGCWMVALSAHLRK